MSDIISLDYETFYSKECSVVDWGYYGYTRHPQFYAYMVSVCDGKETWAGSPDEFDFSMLDGKTLLSHNKAFDEEVMLSDVERGRHAMPKIKAWHCTANMTSYLWNVRSLADGVRIGLGLAVNKGVRDRAKGKTWEDMVKEGWADDMLKYAQLDAQHCWTLFDKFGSLWPDWERRLSDLTIRQGRRGVHIDRPRLEEYMQTLGRVIHTAQQSLPWIERGRAPASPLGMAEECRTANIPPPPVKVDDPEAAEAWEAEYAPQFPWVMGVRNLRKAKKALATMETIKLRLKPDDTVPFSLKYFGAHCLSGDHEVLTPAGWNRLDAWRGGEIAQWLGGRTVFAAATPNQFRGVKERLLRCRTGQVDFQITEGHHVATLDKQDQLILRQGADIFRKGCMIPVSAPRAGGAAVPPERIRLRVAVQADGHYLHDCRSIRFRFTRPRKIQRMRRLLRSARVTFREAVYPSEPRVTVFTLPGFPAWLDGAKQFGPELLGYDLRSLRAFVDELVHWDGTRCGPGSMAYSTTSRANAEWVQAAAHLCGRAAIVTPKARKNSRWATCFNVTIRDRDRSRVKAGDWGVAAKAAGTVYCPTTRHGVFLIRHRGLVCFTGNTGRWAGDAGWNLQNQPKSPLFVLPDGTFELRPDRMKELDYQFETGTLTEAQALDVRGLITARPGFKLVMSDLAQIEPRVLNWMAGNQPLLQLVAAGMSIYEAFARTAMGWTGGELKKEDKKLYQLCKVMVLGLGYGCGWNKFITIAAQYGIDLTEEDEKYAGLAAADGLIHERWFSVEADDWMYSSAPEAAKVKIVEPNFAADPERVIFVKKVKPRTGEEYLQPQGVRGQQSRSIVQKFRDSNPLIVQLWREADEALAAAQGRDYVVPLPSGRKLTYRQVRMDIREFTDPETKKKTEQRCLTAVVGGRRTILYGGLLVENVTQAIGRDVFAHNWLACEDSQVESLFTVHDENVPEVPSGGAEAFASVVQYCMSQCPDWLEGCPVGAETKISERYAK